MAGLFLSRRRLARQCGIGASLLEVGPGPSPRVKKCLSFFCIVILGWWWKLFSSPTGYDFKEGSIENWCLGLSKKGRLNNDFCYDAQVYSPGSLLMERYEKKSDQISPTW